MRYRISSRPFIMLTGFLLIVMVCIIPTLAEVNKTITIDPIGDHKSGEKFNITGSTTLKDVKKIGIEVFPKSFWDSAVSYAKEGDGRIIFMEIPSSKDEFHPAGIKLVRFNSDGTQSFERMDGPQNHWISSVSVEKNSAGVKKWSIPLENNENKTPFSSGLYQVNIWDASNDVEHPGFNLNNGWNITSQKIYPSTARANLWDINNQKDLEYSEFTIRSA